MFFKKNKSGTKECVVANATAHKIPTHVAMIMDGNGRWATLRNKERSYGHKVGAKNVGTVVAHAFKRGIKTVSLYVFSSENWNRPKGEVEKLFTILTDNYERYIGDLIKNGIKLTVSGEVEGLPKNVRTAIENATSQTADCNNFNLNLAINYGGRQEIVSAVNSALKRGEEITVSSIAKYLYTAPFGDPELIIRTGGEQRLSNFMLFQSAYSELYFTEVLWPDFTEEELDKALLSYSNRKRRFGGLKNE